MKQDMGPTKTLLLIVVVLAACPWHAAAQKGSTGSVDWDAKAIAVELGRLGDPEINMFLPEIYQALAESRAEQPNAEPATAKRLARPAPHVLNLLSSPAVRQEIEMLDQQYQERAAEIDEQLARDIARLRARARDKLLRELKSDQRRKFVNLMGEEFHVQNVKSLSKLGGKKGGEPSSAPVKSKSSSKEMYALIQRVVGPPQR